MRLQVIHHLTYRYSEPVALAPQQILLRPREHHHVRVQRFHLAVEPEARLCWVRDHHDNCVAWAYFRERANELDVRAEIEVETFERNPFDFILRPDAVRHPFHYAPAEAAVLAPFLEETGGRIHPLLAWLRTIVPQLSEDMLELLAQLNRALGEHVGFRARLEPRVQPPEETIRRRSGTCRDLAVLMMHVCRALGIAARYVTGYRRDVAHPAGGGLHAWTEVFLPGAGWRGFDAAHALAVDDQYVPVAVGGGPENLFPVSGAFWGRTGVDSTMKTIVEVHVR